MERALKISSPADTGMAIGVCLRLADGHALKRYWQKTAYTVRPPDPPRGGNIPLTLISPRRERMKDDMRIMMHPGHGGRNTGAKAGGHLEKNIVLDVCRIMVPMLQDRGHCAILSRHSDDDISLTERVEAVKLFRPDAVLAVHMNAMPDHDWHGVETFYRDERDKPLAGIMHKHMTVYFGMRDRGLHEDIAYHGHPLGVLSDGPAPTALIEIGYIDNEFNRNYVLNNKHTVAEVIVGGLQEYSNLMEDHYDGTRI